jgi:hypothetical protein
MLLAAAPSRGGDLEVDRWLAEMVATCGDVDSLEVRYSEIRHFPMATEIAARLRRIFRDWEVKGPRFIPGKSETKEFAFGKRRHTAVVVVNREWW